MKEKRRVAFYWPKSLPITNVRLFEHFKQRFSEYQIDGIDLEKVLIRQLHIVTLNAFHTIFQFGPDILLKRKKPLDAFWRTHFIFHQIKKLARQKHQQNHYSFTFQVQSLFDCSVPGVPHFVYTDHTHLANLTYASYDPRKLYPSKWIDLEKTIYDNASLVFVRSENIRSSVEHQYHQSGEKIKCVHAGSNAVIQNSVSTPSRYAKQNLLFVGVDWKRKGGPELFEAFQLVLKSFPNASLTVVGCRPSVASANLKIVGRVGLAELSQYYQDASIFCLPTKEEPFGIAFLEAMSASLPVIGSNVGAIPDFIKPGVNGYLVPANNVQAIVDAITELLKDPIRCHQYGEASKKIVSENYTWEAVCDKMHNHIVAMLPQSV